MATKEQDAFLRSLEEEKSAPARAAASRQGRFMRSGGGGLSVTVTRAAAQNNPVNAGPINFTVTFNKVATGFTNADISFTSSTVGGTLAAAVTGTGPYNVAVTGMTGNGLVRVSVPAGSATDPTGNTFPASNSATVMFDTAQPTVTIDKAADQADPTGGSLIDFTVVFNKVVVGFISSDVTVTFAGGGTPVVTVTGSGANYNAAVTGMTGTGNVVATIPAGAATDVAGNASLASTSTDNSVMFNAATPDFPDATTTGVPTGTILTPVVGNFFTSANGQIVQNLDVPGGSIIVLHTNVTVQRCRASGIVVGAGDGPVQASGGIVQDCTVTGGAGNNSGITIVAVTGGTSDNAKVRRNNVSGTENGIWLEAKAFLIEDNYVHNLDTSGTDPHTDGVQVPANVGVGTGTIRHNNFALHAGSSSSLTMSDAVNVSIDNNRLNGGTYIIYFGSGASGCTVTNNRFGEHIFGYIDDESIVHQTYSGNVDDITGLPIPTP